MKCPSCGGTIPDEIEMCPICGYLIKYSDKSKRFMMPGKYIGAILVILILVTTLGYYMLSRGGDEFAPYDVDFYVSIDGEVLRFGSSEAPSTLLEGMVGDYGSEMSELVGNIDRLILFGWEKDPENPVMIVLPLDTEAFGDLLGSELEVTDVIDANGHDFNLVQDGMGYVWLGDYCVFGSLENVEVCMEVNSGKLRSLNDTSSFKDIMSVIPDYQMIIYASVMDSERVGVYEDMLGEFPEFASVGAIASALSPEEGKIAMAIEMANEEDASTASKKINVAMLALKAMTGDEIAFNFDIEGKGKYVVMTMAIEGLDLEDLLSSELLDPAIFEQDIF